MPAKPPARAHSLSTDERSVSPTIGVVLMVAGTIMLAVVVVPFVLSAAQDVDDSAPSADFSFVYSEGVDESDRDEFDRDGADGQGIVTIVYQSGDPIPAGQFTVVVDDVTYNLASESDWSDDDLVTPGTEINVRADRGQDFYVAWLSSAGDESRILERFAIRPDGELRPPGSPTPDHVCHDWAFPEDFVDRSGIVEPADENTEAFAIEDVTTECDLLEYEVSDVEIVDGDHIGSVEADGRLEIDSGTIWGDVSVTGDGHSIDSGNVTGDLETTKSVTSLSESDIGGELTVGGDLDQVTDSDFGGPLNVSEHIHTLEESQVMGGIQAASIGTIEYSAVFGNLVAEGDISSIDGSTISGDVDSDGRLADIQGSTIEGDVSSESKETSVENSEIEGDVDADSLNLDSSHVSGHVSVDHADDLTCDGDSTINEEDCEEYKKALFEVTIDDTNTPIEVGETLEVTVTVENTRLEEATQEIVLSIDGTEEDSFDTDTLGADETQTETLEWEDADEGEATVTVESEDDEAEETVDVKAEGEAVATLDALTATVSIQENQDQLEEVAFEYELDREDTISVSVFDSDGTQVATDTDTDEEGTIDLDDVDEGLWVTLEVSIEDSDCYNVNVNEGEEDGTAFVWDEDWWAC